MPTRRARPAGIAWGKCTDPFLVSAVAAASDKAAISRPMALNLLPRP